MYGYLNMVHSDQLPREKLREVPPLQRIDYNKITHMADLDSDALPQQPKLAVKIQPMKAIKDTRFHEFATNYFPSDIERVCLRSRLRI